MDFAEQELPSIEILFYIYLYALSPMPYALQPDRLVTTLELANLYNTLVRVPIHLPWTSGEALTHLIF